MQLGSMPTLYRDVRARKQRLHLRDRAPTGRGGVSLATPRSDTLVGRCPATSATTANEMSQQGTGGDADGLASKSGATEACARAAHAERDSDNPVKRKCKHPSNVEYALFFYKLQEVAREREAAAGGGGGGGGGFGGAGHWIQSLGRVASSLCKIPSRIRSIEHANAVTGVGAKTLAVGALALVHFQFTSSAQLKPTHTSPHP